ncbi:MAG: hypothetical protein JWO32_2112 [Bacteroidetes bacterium]|jgi:CheY-like chemotaxis protein|nr:hypothetical protein [Bacteroidota bacterium]
MSGKKILMIVDDDKDNRLFFEIAVRELGINFECVCAENGLEAIELLDKMTVLPDYIFLDLNMPVMGGKECLKVLKMNAKLSGVPVIMYSTSNYMEDIESTKQLGAAYYMPKTPDVVRLPADIALAMVTVGGNRF